MSYVNIQAIRLDIVACSTSSDNLMDPARRQMASAKLLLSVTMSQRHGMSAVAV